MSPTNRKVNAKMAGSALPSCARKLTVTDVGAVKSGKVVANDAAIRIVADACPLLLANNSTLLGGEFVNS